MLKSLLSDHQKINVVIKLNNRKILSGIAEIIGESEKITEFTVAIDKLEKIGLATFAYTGIEKFLVGENLAEVDSRFHPCNLW